jgi:hypothetical protein
MMKLYTDYVSDNICLDLIILDLKKNENHPRTGERFSFPGHPYKFVANLLQKQVK